MTDKGTVFSKVSRIENPEDCLAYSVAEVFGQDPTLEAVTIDHARKSISVATIGKADVPRLTERLQTTLQKAQDAAGETSCSLLSAAGNCHACEEPLTELQRNRITISRHPDSTTIARITCPTAPKFWRWRDIPWPKVVQRDVEFLENAHEVDEWKGQLLAAVLCGLLGLTGYFLHHAPMAIWVYSLGYLAGAWFTAQEVWEKLRERAIDVHFLMLAVAAGSAAIGAWGEGATLLFLFSLSGALEHFALGRTQKEIRSLYHDAPKMALVLDPSGVERSVPVETLRPGARMLIKPGEQFPVDGEVLKGTSAADESNLTGEATPVAKEIGCPVFAGTINQWGVLEASVLRPASESSLQKIIRLIKDAQHQKAPSQRFTDKFSTGYTYAILILSVAMFFVWWRGFHLPPWTSSLQWGHSAFYRTMTLLVVASPCALVLSIPSAVLAAIACGARQGILFRGGAAVEKLAEADIVAIDKTGTLTTGELRVEQVETFPAGREQELTQLAYSIEKLSTHPLARAITRYGKQQRIEPLELQNFESISGHGLRAARDGQICHLGKRDWICEERSDFTLPSNQSSTPGLSELWLAHDQLLGRIVLRDDIRPETRGVLEQLKGAGLRTVVLTGDRKSSADHLKATLGLEDVRAELAPEQKLAAIRDLSNGGHHVAMVGDGVNDAPSLAAAHVGVAMGARGADAALEQADVILMHDRFENFFAAFRLSQRARAIIRQNLVISLGTVAILVTFAMLGRIPLTLGVVGHEGSTVVVVMNSLRLLLTKTDRKL